MQMALREFLRSCLGASLNVFYCNQWQIFAVVHWLNSLAFYHSRFLGEKKKKSCDLVRSFYSNTAMTLPDQQIGRDYFSLKKKIKKWPNLTPKLDKNVYLHTGCG